MNIMTKRGGLDNIATFEHVCDRKADLDNIPKNQITLGSLAIVLKGENDGLEVYMANSKKEWILLMGSSGSGGGGSGIDLSQDTVDVLHLVEGYTAHDSTGAPIVGQVPIRTIDDLIQSGDIITMPGGYYAAATEIRIPPTEYKNLNLIDYDGTLLHAYTTAEALKLEELPLPAEKKEFIPLRWNWGPWTLDDVKRALKKYPFSEITLGPVYKSRDTSQCPTEIDIEISNGELVTPQLGFYLNGIAEIDWGDGSQLETVESDNEYVEQRISHTYNILKTNKFTIKIGTHSSDDLLAFYGDDDGSLIFTNGRTRVQDISKESQIYLDYIKEVRLGRIRIDSYAFCNCNNLSACLISITTLFKNDSMSVFAYIPKLKALAFPDILNKIYSSVFSYNSSIEILSFGCGIVNDVPDFSTLTQLKHVTFSQYMTQVPYCLNHADFTSLPYLESILICNLNDTDFNGVVTMSVFPSIQNINIDKSLIMKSSYNYSNLKYLKKIEIPDNNGTSNYQVDKNLSGCHTLRTLIFPNKTLSSISFGSSTATSVYLPQLKEVFCKATQYYTMYNARPFSRNTELKIYVPYSEDHSILNSYKNATNWSFYADKIFEYSPTVFTIDGKEYTGEPYMTWYDWIFSQANTNKDITIYYDTNELLAPNQTIPFKKLTNGVLSRVFLTDRPLDGAIYVTE